MSFLRRNAQQRGRLRTHSYILYLAFVYLSFVPFGRSSPAQPAKVLTPPANAVPAAPMDPLGRQTPRSSLISFLKYEASGDNATSARFLQLPPDQNLEELTREVR